VAVASAGTNASLHHAPGGQPCQYLTTQFLTGRMPFLPPNQQRQSTEGKDQPTGTIHATSCEASAFRKKTKTVNTLFSPSY